MQNYEGVKGPIRKAVTEVSREAYEQFLRGDTKAIPAWMQISDADGPKAREKKARALKAFKKKLRCASLCRDFALHTLWQQHLCSAQFAMARHCCYPSALCGTAMHYAW